MHKIPFCPQCGKLLSLEIEGKEAFGKCTCGFRKEIKDISFPEKGVREEEKGEGAAKDIEMSGWPHVCEKCGYGECDITEYGPFYSDESSIILYKCKKCGYTERQADGSSNM